MNTYFSLTETVYDLTETYPQLIELLADNGFAALRNDRMRKAIGRGISMEAALKSKQLDVRAFEQKMLEVIQQDAASLSCGTADATQARDDRALHLAGILPCPIRVQLLEKIDAWLATQKYKVRYDLQAASMGLDWLREQMSADATADSLADVYLSAGFSLFFDHSVMAQHLKNGVFTDLTGATRLNAAFDNASIDLKDPRGQYTIIGVVPAIFMVNTTLLGDRPFPERWEDLMQPEFENTVAMPMQDLDLFNAVLLGIAQKYGEDGIAKLGKSLYTSMHPAQMVKAGSKKQQNHGPVVTVMPYFFSFMVPQGGAMRPVWPKDGAIVSPIFLMAKEQSRKQSQPLIDFLFSKEMGEVLSANGKFPSTHPDVDNGLSPEQTFLWAGWDYIYSHDIAALLEKSERIFKDAAEETT